MLDRPIVAKFSNFHPKGTIMHFAASCFWIVMLVIGVMILRGEFRAHGHAIAKALRLTK